MNTVPCLSIIVPVYEGNTLFASLLHDLQRQQLDDIEIILIDDCGTDGSFDYALKAAQTDNRIICLRNKANVGQGICRNMGIEIAKGEYIAFADADDIIPANYYQILYQRAKATNAKVVKGRRIAVYPDGRKEYSYLNKSIESKLASNAPVVSGFTWEHQSAIFSRALIEKTHARNAEGRRDQDTAFLLNVLFHLNRNDFAFAPNARYYYRKHEGAVTANYNYTYLVELMKSFRFKLDFLKKEKHSSVVRNIVAIQAEDRLSQRFCAVLLKNEMSDVEALAFLREAREMLQDFVRIHPLPNARPITQKALDDKISDEELLQHLKDNACSLARMDFAEKLFEEAPAIDSTPPMVHACVMLDEPSAYKGIVMLTSLKSSKIAACNYIVHIFLHDVQEIWQDYLLDLDCPDFRIQLHMECGKELLKKTSEESFACIKQNLPFLLPQVDKLLCLSPEVLIRKHVGHLLNLNMTQHLIAGTPAYGDDKKQKYLQKHAYVLNLENLRLKGTELSTLFKPYDSLKSAEACGIHFLHIRYGVQESNLHDINVVELNKFYGSMYKSHQELLHDVAIIALDCKISGSAFRNVWDNMVKNSPVSFSPDTHPYSSESGKTVECDREIAGGLTREECKSLYRWYQIKSRLSFSRKKRQYYTQLKNEFKTRLKFSL